MDDAELTPENIQSITDKYEELTDALLELAILKELQKNTVTQEIR